MGSLGAKAVENTDTFTIFKSLIGLISKNRSIDNKKITEISYLIDSYLILIIKKAKKLADIGKRKKITYFDLMNSINENKIFLFETNLSNNYRVFQKNPKTLIKVSNKFILPNEIFKQIERKKIIPLIFQSWYKIHKSVKNKKLIYKNSREFFKECSIDEILFLCYVFNSIFDKKKQKEIYV